MSWSDEQQIPSTATLVSENAALLAERAEMLTILGEMRQANEDAAKQAHAFEVQSRQLVNAISERLLNSQHENSELLRSTSNQFLDTSSMLLEAQQDLAAAAKSQVAAQIEQIQDAYTKGATQSLNMFNDRMELLFQETQAATDKQLAIIETATQSREQARIIRSWALTTLAVALAVLVPFTLIWTMLTTGPINPLTEVTTWLSGYWEPAGPILYTVLILALTALPTAVALQRTKSQRPNRY